jgi:prolyl-tRNA synthetase
VEKAACRDDFLACNSVEQAKAAAASTPPYEKIDTPEVKTIDELCAFLKTDAKAFIKTLVYRALNVELDLNGALGGGAPGAFKKQTAASEKLGVEMYPEVFFAVLIRGDLDINETKLASAVKAAEVSLASEADVERLTNAPVGFAGPVGLKTIPIIADFSVSAINNGVTGALAKDLHYKHVACGRDFEPWMFADLRTVVAGDRCSLCGEELYEKKGNELGHIFKLGNKYTKSMNVTYLDENGKSHHPIMGCYGVGLDRTLASVIEEHHDDAGIIWPIAVAPYHVIIIPIKYNGAVMAAADRLKCELEQAGIEVLLDERDERPGVKFMDADLIGIPYRVVIGYKNLAGESPKVEVKRRALALQGAEKETQLMDIDKAAAELAEKIRAELAEYKAC